jgi:CcmD family protein
MIQGGWEYVGAAYAVAWLALIGYGLSLAARRKAARLARPPEGVRS